MVVVACSDTESVSWSVVIKKGFAALNATLNDESAQLFAEESGGNPALMTELCLQTCRNNKVNLREENIHNGKRVKRKISLRVALRQAICFQTARGFSSDLIQLLSRGPVGTAANRNPLRARRGGFVRSRPEAGLPRRSCAVEYCRVLCRIH